MARPAGRRGQRRERSERQGFHQLPWRNLVNPYAPIEVLSADQVETIHRATPPEPRGTTRARLFASIRNLSKSIQRWRHRAS